MFSLIKKSWGRFSAPENDLRLTLALVSGAAMIIVGASLWPILFAIIGAIIWIMGVLSNEDEAGSIIFCIALILGLLAGGLNQCVPLVRHLLLGSSVAYFLVFGTIERNLLMVERKKRAEETVRIERDKLEESITKLVGDSAQVQALLSAIEKLTTHVPEVAERLLGAVKHDLERYLYLTTLASSTTNDVLREKSSQEAKAIATAMRQLTAETTEMALETIEEYEEAEADGVLGGTRGSQLARARTEFKYFLDGLHETRELTPGDTASDRALKEQIDILAPQPEVEKISSIPLPRRRIGGNI